MLNTVKNTHYTHTQAWRVLDLHSCRSVAVFELEEKMCHESFHESFHPRLKPQ